MFLNKIVLPGLCCMLVAAAAQATPLTSFDEYDGSLDLGMWHTDVSKTDDRDKPWTKLDLSGKGRVFGGITYGLNERWGVQYMYHGMAADGVFTMEEPTAPSENPAEYRAASPNIARRTNHKEYRGNTQEFNLLYSLKKGSNVALFVGANRVHNELHGIEYNSDNYPMNDRRDEGTRTHFQGGLIGKVPLGEKIAAYGLVGVGSHRLFQAEAGLSFKIKNNWEANVGYRWFRVHDAFDEHNYNGNKGTNEPWGRVKVQGIQFGITHYFGHAKKKAVIPPVKPPVEVKEVEPPVVVQPPVEPPRKIVLKGVNFDFDKDTLQSQSYPVLNNVADMANQNPQWDFVLVGHTDSMGSDEYNMDLSLRRVKTVQSYLITQGVAEKRLGIDWKGEREPIATNDTEEGRAQNRRVELHIK